MAQKNNTTTMTVRLDTATKKGLERIAIIERRSKSALASQAISNFIAFHEAQIAGIQEALASLERGEGIAHSDVLAWVDSWGTKNEKQMPNI